jgi:hypothetical protein
MPATPEECNRFLSLAKDLKATARTAERGRKSLSGSGAYAKRFHELRVKMEPLRDPMKRLAGSVGDNGADIRLDGALKVLTSTTATGRERETAEKDLDLIVRGTLMPALATKGTPSVPSTDAVIARAVVSGTRGYLEAIVLQANGCYEQRWFDAAAVMVRKLVEILIIEVYEKRGDSARIKNAAGDFLMLGDLVNAIIGDATLNLGRETKATLPKVKALGDRAAHNRRFLARQSDLDAVIPGLRVVVDDLLGLAGLR